MAELMRGGLRAATGLAFMAALVITAIVWVAASHPYDPSQQAAWVAPADPAAALAAPAAPAYPSAVVSITYHAVSDTNPAFTAVTPELLSEHLAALKAAGFHTIRLRDLERLVAGQPVRLPAKPLLLTFDDGVASDWTLVDPLLKAYHFTALAFIITSRVAPPGKPSYYLSTREIQQMAATGRWDLGCHTDKLHYYAPVPGGTAPALTNRILVHGKEETVAQWRTRVSADLARCQAFFRRVVGHPATAFAYPFGGPSSGGNVPGVANIMPQLFRQAGLDWAFYDGGVPPGHIDALGPWSDRYGMERIPTRSVTSVTALMTLIRRTLPAEPVADLSRLPWRGTGAACASAPPGRARSLTVSTSAYGTCALGDLNTSRWRNYTVQARVAGLSRLVTAIIGVRDGAGTGYAGRLEVALGERGLVVRERVGKDPPEVLATAVMAPSPAGPGIRDVRIAVTGDRAVVTVSGAPKIAVTLALSLRAGGVQFAVAAGGPHAVTFESPALAVAPVRGTP
jgi:poly-beta-1,6-N-acetyl-D-glucosamine N-deacetylase